MASYKTGIRTRSNIFRTAKKLFYQRGYNGVKVTDLCKFAEIKLGTFTYYYKTKDHLIQHIYADYMDRIWTYTDAILQTDDAVKLHMYAICLYYFNIYNDPNITFFHHEVFQHISMNAIFLHANFRYECFFNENDPVLADPGIYENLIIADNGCRRELNLRFMESGVQPKLDNILSLIRDIYFVTGRLFSFPTDRLCAYLDEGQNFVFEHLDSNIRLLP